MPTIDDQLRQAMERDGRTMQELAEASGVHRVNLQNFKTGKRGLSLESCEALAAALGLKMALKPGRNR